MRTGAFSNYRAGGIVRGRLVTAQAARAGVPLVIVGAAVCRAAVLAAGVPPGVVCLGVCGVLAVGVGAGAGFGFGPSSGRTGLGAPRFSGDAGGN